MFRQEKSMPAQKNLHNRCSLYLRHLEGLWLACLSWESFCWWTQIIYHLQSICHLYRPNNHPVKILVRWGIVAICWNIIGTFVRMLVSSTRGEWLVSLTWESVCPWLQIIYHLSRVKTPPTSNDGYFLFVQFGVRKADIFGCACSKGNHSVKLLLFLSGLNQTGTSETKLILLYT